METKTITLELTGEEIKILTAVAKMNVAIHSAENADKGVAEMFLPIFIKIEKELSKHIDIESLSKISEMEKAVDSSPEILEGLRESSMAAGSIINNKVNEDNEAFRNEFGSEN